MTLRTRLNQIKIWGVRGTLEAVFRMFREKRIRQVLERNARKNENTVPIRGITVVAPISGSFSLSKAMRDFVIRLHSAGFPCQVFDILSGKGIVAEEDFKDLLTPIQEFNVLKYDHVVEMFNSPLPHGLPVKRCRIAFWEGEAGILKVFPYLVDSDIVVAMSDFNARYFRRELPQIVRVAKILYPLLSLPSNTMEKAVARSRFGIGREDFVVFYNFDIRSDYRKNSIGTLKAFAAAFKGDISCRLLLKINGVGRSKDKMVALQTQAESLGIVNQMLIVTEYLSQNELYSLTNACDVYMSLHRAEGFGLGIAEAMSLGKAVVATDYSATTEFCTAETALLVPYHMVPVMDDGFCQHMKSWAEPDINAAAEALKRLHVDAALREQLGQSAKTFIAEHFSLDNFKRSVESFLEV